MVLHPARHQLSQDAGLCRVKVLESPQNKGMEHGDTFLSQKEKSHTHMLFFRDVKN